MPRINMKEKNQRVFAYRNNYGVCVWNNRSILFYIILHKQYKYGY